MFCRIISVLFGTISIGIFHTGIHRRSEMPFLRAAALYGFAAYQFGLKSEEDQHSDLMLRIVALFSVYFWLYIIFKEWKDSPSWVEKVAKEVEIHFL
ncbi:hypothetical protein Pint_26887 [Pistacia integerrima]|uniref:Uncharacterized protein n=1 Tax=Pistacia integerrima TaxID=434235 RepID=A0ACC0YQQ3_9ROSI|nr:hypothetical protein Pint_26887 [Pistacia integerrima]